MRTKSIRLSQCLILMGIGMLFASDALLAQKTIDIKAATVFGHGVSAAQTTQDQPGINRRALIELYDKADYMIPMRDGVRIYTEVYTPKDQSQTYPFLLSKSPYVDSSQPSPRMPTPGPWLRFMREGFIFVFQHHRGKGLSEGEFFHHPVYIADKKSDEDIDDNSDTYDSIEWLLKNVPNNNGKVGMWGNSYGGWHTAMACIDSHPALVAASPQGTPGDQFIGDDYHHYGAFRLVYAFRWTSRNGRLRNAELVSIPSGTDAYDFFLDLGPISNVNRLLFKDTVPTWNEFMAHPDYDEYWQSKSLPADMYNVKPAVLNVVGWFDAQDYYGALEIYKSIEEKNEVNKNYLVVGPWSHGGWMEGLGNEIGPFELGQNTSKYYREEILYPFFLYHLKGKGEWNILEAKVFITGSNQWREFDSWPPKETTVRNLYLRDNGRLSFEAPGTGSEGAYDSFVSDPDNPVPYTQLNSTRQNDRFVYEDQRFVADREDVLVYESDVLTEDITIAGPIIASLNLATTGTDADWIVKLIDVFPPDALGDLANAQIMIAGEVFRSKYRNSFTNPEPLVPNQVTRLEYDLLDKAHTFLRGHKIMVQVQSTWFPVIDRNPQKFVNIYQCEESDFQKATHRVYRSREFPTHIRLNVIKQR